MIIKILANIDETGEITEFGRFAVTNEMANSDSKLSKQMGITVPEMRGFNYIIEVHACFNVIIHRKTDKVSIISSFPLINCKVPGAVYGVFKKFNKQNLLNFRKFFVNQDLRKMKAKERIELLVQYSKNIGMSEQSTKHFFYQNLSIEEFTAFANRINNNWSEVNTSELNDLETILNTTNNNVVAFA